MNDEQRAAMAAARKRYPDDKQYIAWLEGALEMLADKQRARRKSGLVTTPADSTRRA